jgi:hypothetical protein
MASPRSERRWDRAATALRVVGALLLAASTVHLYAARSIFDAGTFSARAARSLADPRVGGFAAEQITDHVIAQKRDLMAYRPLLVGAVRAIISSEGFRAAFRRAVRRTHEAAFSEGAQRLALSIPDVGVFIRSAVAHDPELAARIPPRLRLEGAAPGGRVSRAILTLAKLGHRFRRNAIVEFGLGALMMLAGIGLPRDRRLALLRGGAVLATVALVVFFLPSLARAAITTATARAELRPLAAGLWDAFTADLRLWALAFGGMGVALAAAASSAARHVEVEQVGRRAWGWLRQPAPRGRGELLRAGLLTAVGLTAALRPVAVLQGLMVVLGVLLAFEGLRQLFVLMPPRIEEAARFAEEALGGSREQATAGSARTWLHHGLVGVLVLALIAAGILFINSPGALPRAPALTDACNGDRALCDRRLDQVVFPGAHNSMAAADVSGWMFPNQELGSAGLLRRGIRALLFDVHYGMPVSGSVKTDLESERASRAKIEKAVGPEAIAAAMRVRDRVTGAPTGPRAPFVCHGFCELGAEPLQDVLEGVRDFLVQSPGDVVVLVIEDYVPPADVAAAFSASGLDRFVYRGPVTPPFPTLREMIDSDQRVVVFGENETSGVPWYHPAFETIQETPYRFLSPAEFSCRPNRGGTSAPLFQVNHWIETTPAPKPSNAAIVNARDFLYRRARQCQKERGRLPNILAVDFAMTGDLLAVTAELNGLGTGRP